MNSPTRDRFFEAAALGGLLASLYLLLDYSSLPDDVPKSFDLSGAPQRWGNKGVLFVLPTGSLLLYLLLTFLGKHIGFFQNPRLTPEEALRECDMTRLTLCVVKAEVSWLFAYIEWRTIRVALGQATGLGPYFTPVLLIILLATIGWIIWSCRRESALTHESSVHCPYQVARS